MQLVLTPTTLAPVQTWLPPWGLSACFCAALGRNIQGLLLTESQRWAHYPVTPLCSINLMFDGTAELASSVGTGYAEAPRRQLAAMTVSGPQTCPRSILYTPNAHGVMIVFYPDAWSQLTGMAVTTLVNQVVDAREVLSGDLLAICTKLWLRGADAQGVPCFFDDVLPLWLRSSAAGQPMAQQPLPHSLTPWMHALAMRAATTGWGRSLRQSERRIKQWTGWSLRRLQVSARGEAVFFTVMAALNDDRLDWTQIALDHGFSDQSHFIRETRRLTGFSPEAMRQGVLNEEAFWSYRAWAKLADL